MSLAAGEMFPEIDATTHDGQRVRSAELRGSRNLVAYFYPKDLTPGCTREANDFEQRLTEFRALDTEVVGVSVDPAEAHERFTATCGLHFPLVSDEGGQLAQRLGILNSERGTARRTTFVVDKAGVVRHVFNVASVDGHADEVLAAVRGLGA